MESKVAEGLLPVRVVLGGIAVLPLERASIPSCVKVSEAFGGLVKLCMGPETLAFGDLCLHRGKLAVRVAKVGHLTPGGTKPIASVLESEGV